MTRCTAVQGNALEANTTRELDQRADSSRTYSRARSRRRLLDYHEDRRTEFGRKIIDPATTNDEHAVSVSRAIGWKEIQQLAHVSMVDR